MPPHQSFASRIPCTTCDQDVRQRFLGDCLLSRTTSATHLKLRVAIQIFLRDLPHRYRVESDIPSVAALTVTAPGVRFKDFAILTRPAFCLAIVLRSLTSSFDHSTRLLIFFGIIAPTLGAPSKRRCDSRQGTSSGSIATVGFRINEIDFTN
jgi:hypothetical protein